MTESPDTADLFSGMSRALCAQGDVPVPCDLLARLFSSPIDE